MLKFLHGSLDYRGNYCNYHGDHLSYDFLTVAKFNYEKKYLNRFIKIVNESFTNSAYYKDLVKLYDDYVDGSKESLDKLAKFYFTHFIDIYVGLLQESRKKQLVIRSLDFSNSTRDLLLDFIFDNSTINSMKDTYIVWESFYDYISELDLDLPSSDFYKDGEFNIEKVVEQLKIKKVDKDVI